MTGATPGRGWRVARTGPSTAYRALRGPADPHDRAVPHPDVPTEIVPLWPVAAQRTATSPGPPAAPPVPVGLRDRGALRWLGTVAVAAAVAAGTVVALGPSEASPAAASAKVASPEDTGWQPLEVTGGWVVTGDGARYRVIDGVCHLQVHVRDLDGVWGANAPLAVLPPGTAPAWHMGFVATRDGVPFGEVKVFSDGKVLMVLPGDGRDGRFTVSASFPTGD